MKKRLTRVAPLRAGIVLCILYGIVGLLFTPFFLVAAIASKEKAGEAAIGAVVAVILFPVIYAIGGFIGGIIAAALYNLVAKWTGGLEFGVTDATPAA